LFGHSIGEALSPSLVSSLAYGQATLPVSLLPHR
jgi:hypothetical protein